MPSDTERERTEAGRHAANVDRLTGQVGVLGNMSIRSTRSMRKMAEHLLGTTGDGRTCPTGEGQRATAWRRPRLDGSHRAPGQRAGRPTVESIAGELGKRAGDLGERRRCALTQLLDASACRATTAASEPSRSRSARQGTPHGPGRLRCACRPGRATTLLRRRRSGRRRRRRYEVAQHLAPGGGQIDIGNIDRHGVGGMASIRRRHPAQSGGPGGRR